MGGSNGRIRPTAWIAPALAAFALAACGGSGDGEPQPETAASGADEEQIREVLLENLTAEGEEKPEIECERTVTDDYVELLYGDLDTCREQAEKTNERLDGPDAEQIGFPRIALDGDRAEAEVRVTGGDLEGIEGTLLLIRDPARGWLLDDFDAEIARSVTTISLGQTVGGGELAECIDAALFGDAPNEEAVKQTFIDLTREEGDAVEEASRVAGGCLESAGDVDLLREQFEESLRIRLEEQEGLDQAIADCVIRRSRRAISDEDIETIFRLGLEGEPPRPAIESKLRRIGTLCTRRARQSNRTAV